MENEELQKQIDEATEMLKRYGVRESELQVYLRPSLLKAMEEKGLVHTLPDGTERVFGVKINREYPFISEGQQWTTT